MNKPSKLLIGLALAAAGALSAGSAFAQHHHHGGPRVSIGFGFGPYWGPGYWGPGYWGSPWYYPPPAYYPYPAPIVMAPPAPTQYVERSDQPMQSGYWYYCETSRGYYPYVRDCPSGWRAVPPAPPPAQ
ncbi:MAG TPA: hypothetical protein VEQ87_17730 [Burkholderiales bacterium]|nr:hypothetical protein [Burkholderiales bacterium]